MYVGGLCFLYFQLHSFPPFHLSYFSYFGVSVGFLCRAPRRRLSQDGITIVSVPTLIKEPSVEHLPTQVLKVFNEWLK